AAQQPRAGDSADRQQRFPGKRHAGAGRPGADAAGPGRGAGVAAHLHPAPGGRPVRLPVQARHPAGVQPMRMLWLIPALLLAGCSILPEAEELRVYQLPRSAPDAMAAPANREGEVLRINRPRAAPLLDSTRIVVMPRADQLSAYQGVRWSDRGPVLVSDRLVEGVRERGRFKAVGGDDLPAQAALELAGELNAFQIEYREGRPLAVIRLQATLLRGGSREVLASRGFSIERETDGASVDAAVEALARGGEALAGEVANWLAEQAATPGRTARAAH